MDSVQPVEPDQVETCGGNKRFGQDQSPPPPQSSRGSMTQTSNQTYSIGIAGAGLLGRLLAWRLSLGGHKVSLFEAGEFNPQTPLGLRAAAFTAAGMVAPLSEAVVSDADVFRMGQFALARWPQWLEDLDAPEPLFFSQGSLVVAHPQDYSELDQFEQELRHILPGCNSYRRLNQQDIQQLEPDLNSGFQDGLFLAEEGHLHNRELLNLLATQIQALGVEVHQQHLVETQKHSITSDYQQWHFDRVIDCRGMGAKQQLPRLRGVRGETLHIETSEVHLKRPVRLMHPRYQLYVVPKPKQRFIIGATQIESEDRSPVSLQSSLELGSALYTLSPAFAEARILEMDTNLRPALIDNLPLVDVQQGLIVANGLFRHGYLLAPAVVENILAHLNHNDDAPFSAQLNRIAK